MAVERWTSELLDSLATRADPGVDTIVAAFQDDERPDENPRQLIKELVHHGPGSTHAEFISEYHRQAIQLPDWSDAASMALGQEFFGRWSLQLASSLFYASLPNAYAVEHGAKVLVATGRLSDHSDALTRRIAETGQFLLEVFTPDGSTPLSVGGDGYVAVRNVRLFHAAVRYWLTNREEGWPDENGVPINQEDLIGTLLSFTVAAFDAFDRMRVPYKEDQARAYFHTWNNVGFLLGIEPDLLPIEYDHALDLAELIAERHQRPSDEGRELTEALVEDGQGNLPPIIDKIPATLVYHLAGEKVAEMHRVKRPARPMLVGAKVIARINPVLLRVQRRLSINAWVGRKVLRSYIARERGGRPPWMFEDEIQRRRIRPIKKTIEIGKRVLGRSGD